MNPSGVITFQEFESLARLEKSEYLRANFPAGAGSFARRSAVYWVGVNDADYLISPRLHGVKARCPAYTSWFSMLQRAICPKFHARSPSYIGVTVCREWLSFMAFRRWWITNHVGGYSLDKDLLGDSRQYGPRTCIFVPTWLNTFTNDCKSVRGDSPLGVDFYKPNMKYRARCEHPFGRHEHLGYFNTADAAHLAWKSRKLEIAEEIKPRIDEIDTRIYPRIVSIIEVAK